MAVAVAARLAEKVLNAFVGHTALLRTSQGKLMRQTRPIVERAQRRVRPLSEKELRAALLPQEVLGRPLVDGGLFQRGDGGGTVVEDARVVAAAPHRDSGDGGRARGARLADGSRLGVGADVEALQVGPGLVVDDVGADGDERRQETAQQHQATDAQRHRTASTTNAPSTQHTSGDVHTETFAVESSIYFVIFIQYIWRPDSEIVIEIHPVKHF